eukprot:TRINITY_DN3525_c0_g2_i2.p1 TRINITY_DN3525_c0_g2~~TRINITY_DN3525_c0_g2_i2.p1  ORF type:complete len:120 (+),score=10.07 TRINITY_DN3525_c0_g2_i2:348-707(+)
MASLERASNLVLLYTLPYWMKLDPGADGVTQETITLLPIVSDITKSKPVNLFSTCGCSVRFLIAMIKAKVVDSKLGDAGETRTNEVPPKRRRRRQRIGPSLWRCWRDEDKGGDARTLFG